jgi:hypothetical protein
MPTSDGRTESSHQGDKHTIYATAKTMWIVNGSYQQQQADAKYEHTLKNTKRAWF